MKKIIVLLLILIVSASLFCACSEDKDKKEDKGRKDSDKSSENVSDPQDSLPDNSAADESDLFSFNLKLDGVKYTLPCDVTEFEKNGWTVAGNTVDDVPEKKMKPGDSAGYELYKKDENTGEVIKNNSKYSIYADNFSKSDMKLKDCKIYDFYVSISNDSEPKGPEVELPGGLIFDFNTQADDIIALYGEPQDIAYNEPYSGTGDYIRVDLDYKKREGDFIKNIHFTVYENAEEYKGTLKSSVLMQYVYKPENEE